MHHVRTLRIMSDVYCKGLLTDLQLEGQMVEKMFPMLEDLLELHSFFFSALLEKKKEGKLEGMDGFIINRIGDVLVSQVRTFDYIYQYVSVFQFKDLFVYFCTVYLCTVYCVGLPLKCKTWIL